MQMVTLATGRPAPAITLVLLNFETSSTSVPTLCSLTLSEAHSSTNTVSLYFALGPHYVAVHLIGCRPVDVPGLTLLRAQSSHVGAGGGGEDSWAQL